MKKPLKLSLGSAVVTGVMSAVLVPATAASATTTQECGAQLATLRSDTVAAQSSFTNQSSYNSEVAKLDAASTKLADGKSADAVEKLTDFRSTLASLAAAPKPKVDETTAQTLGDETQGVIDCINAIA